MTKPYIVKLQKGDTIKIESLNDRVLMIINRVNSSSYDYEEFPGASREEHILLAENSRLKTNMTFEVI